MNHHELYSMKNFDFLALSFARMHAQGQPLISRPLSAIWMKIIVNGFANGMNSTAVRSVKRQRRSQS
jgi:hypothetical protein